MTKRTLHIIASLLILAGLALIVFGLQQQNVMWQIGLAAVALAMLLSFATRWAPEAPEEQETTSS